MVKRTKHPLTDLLRKPPLPLPGEEETPMAKGADLSRPGFLSPGQGERWTGEVGTVRGRFAPFPACKAHWECLSSLRAEALR